MERAVRCQVDWAKSHHLESVLSLNDEFGRPKAPWPDLEIRIQRQAIFLSAPSGGSKKHWRR